MRIFILLILLLQLPIYLSCQKKLSKDDRGSEEKFAHTPPLEDAKLLAESVSCRECHASEFGAWEKSQHHHAHRKIGSSEDEEAFSNHQIGQGTAKWEFSGGKEQAKISWQDGEEKRSGLAEMAIGVTPLIQYILFDDKGRGQVPDMAWDVQKKEWFSMFGEEQREAGDWGHWTGRGMNWNSQCAACHFTGFRKNYEVKKDSYNSSWREQGVGCAQCHGPLEKGHGTGVSGAKGKATPSAQQWMESCATCHSRREEFDEKFQLGRSFHDHYGLSLPSQPGLWYADGQQLDEVYNYTGFLLSRMGHKGVSCIDCHDPHSGEPKGGKKAVMSNQLCMTCHAGGDRGATIIKPAEHSRHKPGTAGSRCIDCHMPTTDYMQRDPRHDHRFASPDPLLTKELGIPNSCAKCHSDQGTEWQIRHAHDWYGEGMNAVSRRRARALHAAQNGKEGAFNQLTEAYEKEEIDAWQATLLRAMEPWAESPRVRRYAKVILHESDAPLARAAAARILGLHEEISDSALQKALVDPKKAVRVEAGWAALERLPKGHPLLAELKEIARHHADQPIGALRMARLAMAEGDIENTEKWMRKAADWDSNSPAIHGQFATFLGNQGRAKEALPWLEKAIKLAPQEPEYPYLMALVYAELGDTEAAQQAFKTTLGIDPSHTRAWYNLGLLQNQLGDPEQALKSLQQAANTDTSDPRAPYAQATILLQLGRKAEAREAARETLRRDPQHTLAQRLLQE